MAYIYAADVYCDSCGKDICKRIANEKAAEFSREEVIELLESISIACNDEESTSLLRAALAENYLDGNLDWEFSDENNYDSENYPKSGNDDDESDSPQHCGAGEDCLEAEELSDGSKIGCLIGTNLTDEGVETVKRMVAEDKTTNSNPAYAAFLRERFNDIDFADDSESDAIDQLLTSAYAVCTAADAISYPLPKELLDAILRLSGAIDAINVFRV